MNDLILAKRILNRESGSKNCVLFLRPGSDQAVVPSMLNAKSCFVLVVRD